MISRAATYVWPKDVQKYLGLNVHFSFSHLFFLVYALAHVNVPNVRTSVALDNPTGEETSNDVYAEPASRIHIAQITSSKNTGIARWEISSVRSRPGAFDRTIKLHDGSEVPVKLVLN